MDSNAKCRVHLPVHLACLLHCCPAQPLLQEPAPWNYRTAVALTQISAHTTHKNPDVRKIMEAMRTQKTALGLNTSHTKHDATITEHTRVCERKVRIACEEHFISLNRLMNLLVKVLLKCNIRFSTSFRWYAFPNFCKKFLVHSSKASATADRKFIITQQYVTLFLQFTVFQNYALITLLA